MDTCPGGDQNGVLLKSRIIRPPHLQDSVLKHLQAGVRQFGEERDMEGG